MARMQWAAEGKGNHNPIVVVNGHQGPSPLVLLVKAGDNLRLDASLSSDPDFNTITFNWWQQPEIGSSTLTIPDATQPVINITIPNDAAGQCLHLVCEVQDQALFYLKSYQRIILNVEESGVSSQ